MWKGHSGTETETEGPGCDNHPSPDIRHVSEETMLGMSVPVEII